jgi:hypothetical protein
MGYTSLKPDYIITQDTPYYVCFGDHTRTFNIVKNNFSVMDNVKVLMPLNKFSIKSLIFITSSWRKGVPSKGYARHWSLARKAKIQLPTNNNEIDFEFMESFVAELEAQRLAELEAYLTVTGLKDYVLTEEEEKAIKDFECLDWLEFNLLSLFGKSTRGKRLKSADRIPGKLPFITAGEANEGFSDYIGNDVEVFPENTITIDMFGSAKYRNYEYGCDDHIAVVHTEEVSKNAAIFITSAIHKSSYNGQFHYGRNFYAKDADELNIMLPVNSGGNIDYEYMSTLLSAIQKLVIKDVVLWADKKIEATKHIINKQ